MKNRWFTRGMAALGLLGACVLPAHAFYEDNENVKRLNADPTPPKAESHINDYINQDEQLNLQPTDGVVKVLRTDQKIMVNDFETAVFPLRHALPREMRNVMSLVTGIEGGRAEVIQDKIKKEYFIQVMAPRYMIPYLRDAVAALDVPWLKEYWDGATDIYIKAQHRPAADIDPIASQWASPDGYSVIDTTNNAIRRYDDDYRTKEYAKGAAIVDQPVNQVLLDVKLYEVDSNNDLKLGVDFINWKNGPGRNLWNFAAVGFGADQRAKGLTSIFDPFIDANLAAPDETRKVLDSALSYHYRSVNYLLTSNYVDFLQSKGKARLLTGQKVLVASANTATITAEQQLLAIVNNDNDLDTVKPDRAPVVIVRQNNGNVIFLDRNGNGVQDKDEPSLYRPKLGDLPLPRTGGREHPLLEDSNRRLNYRSAGVATTALTVTPFVGLDSMELDLDLQIGDVGGVAPSGLPILNTRTLSTTVRLLDGQPYVISGIKRTHDSKNSNKVPYLGDIPVLGYAFGGNTTLKRESNLVVTVTPHFILATQKSIAPAPQVEELKAVINGQAELGLPQNTPGYDQWLLNS